MLSIDKSVTDAHPRLARRSTTTIDISNLAGPNTSNAYNITVVDTVPVGVVVDPGSISDGGVLSGAGAERRRHDHVDDSPDRVRRGHHARRLQRDARRQRRTLTTAPLTNTADITHYESLPSGRARRTRSVRHRHGHDRRSRTSRWPKQAQPGPAYIGQSKSFTLTITSDGNATAYNIGGTDTLPVNWTYDTGSAMVSVNGGPAVQVEPDIVTQDGVQTLSLPDLFDLPAGEAVVITYSATPQAAVVGDPGVGSTIPHTNTLAVHATDATGATGNADGPYTDPPVTATVRIDSADVTIDKSHTGNAVRRHQASRTPWSCPTSAPTPRSGRSPSSTTCRAVSGRRARPDPAGRAGAG